MVIRSGASKGSNVRGRQGRGRGGRLTLLALLALLALLLVGCYRAAGQVPLADCQNVLAYAGRYFGKARIVYADALLANGKRLSLWEGING